MEINYLGHSCFKVTGKKISILMDPFDQAKVGIKLGKQDADVVTVSHAHADHSNLKVMKNDGYLLLDSPGEYEIKDSEFIGIEAFHDDVNGDDRGKVTIFVVEVEGVRFAHLGDLATELTSDQLERLDGVDVLMIPVGGVYTLDAKLAVKVISQIEPKIVLPMHFKVSESADDFKDLATIDVFLQEMGVKPELQDKLKISRKDLPEELTVITLRY